MLAVLHACGTMTLPQESLSGAPISTAQAAPGRSAISNAQNPGQPQNDSADSHNLPATSVNSAAASDVPAAKPVKSVPSAADTQKPVETLMSPLASDGSDRAGKETVAPQDHSSPSSTESSPENTDDRQNKTASVLDTPLTKIQDNKIVIKSTSKDIDPGVGTAQNTSGDQQNSQDMISSDETAANNTGASQGTGENQKSNLPKQVDVKPTAVSEAEVKYKLASRYYQSNRYQNAIDVLESSDQNEPDFPKSKNLLVNAYLKLSKQQVSRKEFVEAKALLVKAKRIAPENAEVDTELTKVDNILESNKEFKLAMEANNAGKLEVAFLKFKRVLELNPNNSEASKYYSELKETVVTKRHKNALKLFRSQKLNAAIEEWEQLLKLDPNNELAKIYISRAIEMRNRIENL